MEPPDFGDSSSDSDSDDEGLVEEEPAPKSPGQAKKKRKKPGSAKKAKDGKSKGPPPPKKKRKEGGLIDDAAVESGDEDGDDDDDEDGDEDNNDYERDGFVVGEDEAIEVGKKAEKGALEDSDSEDEDEGAAARRKKKIRKVRDTDVLDEDDLDLIAESRGLPTKRSRADEEERLSAGGPASSNKGRVQARNSQELSQSLFTGDTDDEDDEARVIRERTKPSKASEYDEDGLDDFIEDDVGGDGYGDDLAAAGGTGGGGTDGAGVSEAQLQEHLDIFGDEFMDFYAEGREGGGEGGEDDDGEYIDGERRDKYRERGVGINYGMDSDEEVESDSDDGSDDGSLFGDDDDDEDDVGGSGADRAEVLRLKREKKRLNREERRKAKRERAERRRRARLRRAFEPVQLVENFCTERDDAIRLADVPERYYPRIHDGGGKKKKRDPPPTKGDATPEEQEEAHWIAARVPAIERELLALSATMVNPGEEPPTDEQVQEREGAVLDSIVLALRYMRGENLEPDFVKRYRADAVASPAVRDNLHAVLDEDAEWERLVESRSRAAAVLAEEGVRARDEADGDDGGDDAGGGGRDAELIRLRMDLRGAEDRLRGSRAEKERLGKELAGVDEKAAAKKDDDDDDDDLFGDEEDDDATKEAKEKQKASIKSHLETVESLIESQAAESGRLADLVRRKEESLAEAASAAAAEAASAPSSPSARDREVRASVRRKSCRSKLYNHPDYSDYIDSMIDYRHVMDMRGYLNLIREGNEAVTEKAKGRSAGARVGRDDAKDKRKKRSRRFDWDYYRTCVSEGLRDVAYRFLLPPFKLGIKLDDTMNSELGFSYDRTLAGEDGDEVSPTERWTAPVVDGASPTEYGNRLADSGELVSLASGGDADWDRPDPDAVDPLRAARYVASMEVAHEPRVRRTLRDMYRQSAVLSTRPTARGAASIDAFHEFYGLHLLRDKPVRDHFPSDPAELERKRQRLDAEEAADLERNLRKAESDSCLRYLSLLRADRSGDISLQVHLPYVQSSFDDPNVEWHKRPSSELVRERQNIKPMMDVLERCYLPAGGDTDEWNEERRRVLRSALLNHLLPQFESETRRDLRDAAVKAGVAAAGESLRSMATEGPYRPSHYLGENRFVRPTGDIPVVGVCSSSDAREGTYLAAVTGSGEVADHVAVPGGTNVDSHRERIVTFLMTSRPEAVVVGSSGGVGSRATARRLAEIVQVATEKWNNRFVQAADEDDEDFEARMESFRRMHSGMDLDDDEDEVWKCNVDIVDDNVAQLFGRSVRGKKEFPEFPTNLKVAVSCARYAKDPLGELAYTWSAASDAGVFGTEMLYLNIHPLQRLVPRTLLLREYERVLCGVTADVGVDVNAACAHDHVHGLLTFVPGLGPRKANNLRQSAERIGGVVSNRKAVLAKRMLGPVVYNNAVAFLRVRATDQLEDQRLHPLDDSRCHPDVYQRNRWAVKIAVDALELGDSVAQDDENAITAIRDIMDDSQLEVKRLYDATKSEWERAYGSGTFNTAEWDPKLLPPESWRDKIEELDIEAFADMIEQNGSGKWLTQLTMTKWELRMPYEDPRKPMEPPQGARLFKLLTGETDASLCPGKHVTGKVIKNNDFGSQIKLEGDVPGFIPLRNLADDHVESADDIVQVGTVVNAIITQVKMDHMCVDLSLKREDFKKKSSEWERPASLAPLDPYFDRAAALAIDAEKDKERDERLESLRLKVGGTRIEGDDDAAEGGVAHRRSGKVTRRACAHPAFRNATHDTVDRELKDAGDAMIGEALVRPSNKSCDSLAVHWMVRPGCIKVIEVLEEDKDTDASIGNRLIVKKEVYESIDELLGRFIAPMNDRVEEVQHHRKFMDKLEDEVDERLQEMKRANPKGVFYQVCWSESYPGYISLRFIMNRSCRHHTIGITPDGFLWGGKTFGNLDRLMNEFKKNPQGPGARKPASAPSQSSSSSQQSYTTATDSISRQSSSRWGSRVGSSAGGSRDSSMLVHPGSLQGMPLPPPAYNQAPPPGQPPAFNYH